MDRRGEAPRRGPALVTYASEVFPSAEKLHCTLPSLPPGPASERTRSPHFVVSWVLCAPAARRDGSCRASGVVKTVVPHRKEANTTALHTPWRVLPASAVSSASGNGQAFPWGRLRRVLLPLQAGHLRRTSGWQFS